MMLSNAFLGEDPARSERYPGTTAQIAQSGDISKIAGQAQRNPDRTGALQA